jgi:hypothetical protein
VHIVTQAAYYNSSSLRVLCLSIKQVLEMKGISWPFVKQVLEMKGVSSQWCGRIDTIIQGGHVGIKINDQVSQNFQTKKGLRHGIRYHHCYLI